MSNVKGICNIPEDLLKNQVMIDTIPQITQLLILTAITVVVVYYWYEWRHKLSDFYQVISVISMLIVFIPTWYMASGILVDILTSYLNPEYAAILKFNNTCG